MIIFFKRFKFSKLFLCIFKCMLLFIENQIYPGMSIMHVCDVKIHSAWICAKHLIYLTYLSKIGLAEFYVFSFFHNKPPHQINGKLFSFTDLDTIRSFKRINYNPGEAINNITADTHHKSRLLMTGQYQWLLINTFPWEQSRSEYSDIPILPITDS